MYTTMAEANTPLPFGQSYLDYLPNVLAMVEKANFAAAKALHQKRMKDVCYSIKAHHYWEAFEMFFPTSFSQHCLCCGELIFPEFDMRRHRGLCDLKERLADKAFDSSLAQDSFYSHTSPYISRSSYTSPHLV